MQELRPASNEPLAKVDHRRESAGLRVLARVAQRVALLVGQRLVIDRRRVEATGERIAIT